MTPACEVIPFPAVRRIGFIRRQARLLAHYNPDAAERTLAAQLNAQRAAMLRRSIPPEVVERELRSLELAVRTELWTIVMQSGGAA
jgi:Family of unknown function (DUF6074)